MPTPRLSVRFTPCNWLRRDLTSVITAELARRYQTEGVNAYVDLIQNRERELGIDIITHQKWFVPSNPFHYTFISHTR